MYSCIFCNEKLRTDRDLRLHVRGLHKSLLNSEIQCPYENCLKKYANFHNYKKHFISNHSSENVARCSEEKSIAENPAINEIINNTGPFATQFLESSLITSNFNIEKHEKQVRYLTDVIVSKLYAKSKLPRSHVIEIVEDFREYINLILIDPLQNISNNLISNHSSDFENILVIAKRAFEPVSTEHLAFKRFEELGCFIKPLEDIVIDTAIKSRRVEGKKKIAHDEVGLAIVPFGKVLRKFLELPNVFSTTMAYIQKCKQSESYHSIVQSELWKQTEIRLEGKIVLPLEVYFDDHEINNALGAHKGDHEIGGVYGSLACIPPEFSSMLENILILQLHHTIDHKCLNNKAIFTHVIDQLIDLDVHGIEIQVEGQIKRVYFPVIGLAADNLGAHQALGYKKGFNANYPCRICFATKEQCRTMVMEDPSLLSTPENYKNHVADLSHGVSEECIFNRIPNFNVIENSLLDFQHDIQLGICRYEVPKILKRFIDQGIFSLQAFNYRLRNFDFGPHSDINIPPEITENDLEIEQLKTSSSEMSTLIRYLGLIIGDLIPPGNEVWEMYKLLREIICLLMAGKFEQGVTTKQLATLVEKHHTLYVRIFEEPLKPKFHHLTHYPGKMEQLGPIIQFSCTRYEGKHKESKDYSKVMTSRVNPAHSLLVKHQLRLSYRFLLNKGFDKRVTWGSSSQWDLNMIQDDGFSDIVSPNLDVKLCASWVRVCGTLYQKDMIISVDSGILTYFGKILYLIVTKSEDVFFVFKKVNTLSFFDHVHAFAVVETNQWGCISQKDLIHSAPCSTHIMANGNTYVPCYK